MIDKLTVTRLKLRAKEDFVRDRLSFTVHLTDVSDYIRHTSTAENRYSRTQEQSSAESYAVTARTLTRRTDRSIDQLFC